MTSQKKTILALSIILLSACNVGQIDYQAPVDCELAVETVYLSGHSWYLVSPEYEISQQDALKLCIDTTVLMERDGHGRAWREYIDSVIAGNTEMFGGK